MSTHYELLFSHRLSILTRDNVIKRPHRAVRRGSYRPTYHCWLHDSDKTRPRLVDEDTMIKLVINEGYTTRMKDEHDPDAIANGHKITGRETVSYTLDGVTMTKGKDY